MKNSKIKGFTLIELLMVIAIIGILAGILIPTVGAVRKQANIAASKTQLSNYVTAITMFKGEYGYLPFVTGAGDTTINLSTPAESERFIRTLSGRNPSTGASVAEGGNRRQIAFHSFAESEFFISVADAVSDTQLADRFNNTNIFIMLDGNGDGRVNPSPSGTTPRAPSNPLRTVATAWVEPDESIGAPGYALWD